MKKASIIFLLATIVFACSRKTLSTSDIAPAVSNTEVTTNNNTDLAKVESGKTIYTTKCSKCHTTKEVTAYTASRWEGILKNMIPKAKLDETEAQQVTAYVMEQTKK